MDMTLRQADNFVSLAATGNTVAFYDIDRSWFPTDWLLTSGMTVGLVLSGGKHDELKHVFCNDSSIG